MILYIYILIIYIYISNYFRATRTRDRRISGWMFQDVFYNPEPQKHFAKALVHFHFVKNDDNF